MSVVRACKHCGVKNRLPLSRLADVGRCGECKAAIEPLSEPIAADARLFDEILGEARVPVLVDFWAEWCGPCRMAAPHVARTAAEMAGQAIVLKVDTEHDPQLAARYNVQGIPNFAIFRHGKLVQQRAGLVEANQMVQWLKAAADTNNS